MALDRVSAGVGGMRAHTKRFETPLAKGGCQFLADCRHCCEPLATAPGVLRRKPEVGRPGPGGATMILPGETEAAVRGRNQAEGEGASPKSNIDPRARPAHR